MDRRTDDYVALKMRVLDCTTWREIARTCFPSAALFAPATSSDLDKVKRILGHGLQTELEELLLESNGIRIGFHDLIYSTTRIAHINQMFRDPQFLADLRMPFDNLLFFGGNEDPFAFPVLKNGTVGDGVFQWSHETDGREQYAYGLRDYFITDSLLQ